MDETLPDKFTGNTRLSKKLNKMLHALNTAPWRRWDCVARPGIWSLLDDSEVTQEYFVICTTCAACFTYEFLLCRGQLDETLPDKFTGNTRLSKNLNKMLHALNTVPWRRWDCVARPGMWSLLNHNELIVKHPRHLNYGAPVMDHLVETLLI